MSQGSPPRMEIGGLFPGEYPGDLRAPESSLAHHLICLEEVRRGGSSVRGRGRSWGSQPARTCRVAPQAYGWRPLSGGRGAGHPNSSLFRL